MEMILASCAKASEAEKKSFGASDTTPKRPLK
jgi:hypothetical protein